jgi:hypothetical protein
MAANFWESDAVVKSEDQWWSKDPEATAPAKDKGFFSNVGSLLVEGGKRAIGAAQVSPSVIAGDVGEDKAKLLSEQLSMKPSVQPKQLVEAQTAFKDEAEAFEKAKGFTESIGPFAGFLLEFGKQVITNPKGAVYLTAQSAANMAPQIAGMIAGGKGAALAASPAGPQVAALAGAAGAVGGGFAAGVPLEIGSEFIGRISEKLSERGLPPTEENIAALLRDKTVVEQAISEARTKGVTTAAVDSLMTVGAGKFATGPRRAAIETARKEMGAAADAAKLAARADEILKARTMTQKVGRGAGAVGIETAGGGASEAAGQLAAYGKVNLEDVGAEMLGELGGSAASVPAAAYSTTQDMLRGQARTEAGRILKEEEEAKRIAEEGAKNPPLAPSGQGVPSPESLQQPTPDPYTKRPSISGTRPDVLLGVAEDPLLGGREDPLARAVTERRAAAEPVGEIPLGDDYAFLQREKQRLLQGDQTPETKKLLGRIDEQLREVLKRDIERLRVESETLKRNREADAEATRTSVFGQEELPPVESRDVVMGNMELEKLQEREAPPVDPLTGREARGVGKMEGVPQPMIPEVEAEIEKLTQDQGLAVAERDKLAKRTSGTSLTQVLRGALRDAELSELGGRARQVGKNPFLNLKAPKGQPGSSMEDMVDSGKLDIFLPVKMRPDSPDYVNSESAEYVRDKLRNNQPYTYETELAIQQVENDIESIERQIQDLLSDDEINKELQYAADEQRELDQVTQEPAAPEADRTPEQREAEKADADFEKRKAQLDREEQLNEREARLLEERKRLEEERLKLESPTKDQVVEEEERKAKAPELDEREQIRKESEAGAGQFELTREEGRQDTTGDIFNQPEPEPTPEPKVVAISPEQERKEALENFALKLRFPILPFRARSANKTQLLKPADLTPAQVKEIVGLASDALDLGMPPLVLGNVTAAGSTRMDVVAVMSSGGSLMIAKKWKDSSKAEKLQTLIHELAHAVDTAGGKPSEKASWAKAHAELQGWYTNSANKPQHPLAYPFAPQFRGRVRPKEESFAQAFAYYFVSPVDLQTNAPEAYSQIQSIIERIQDGSQEARATGTTKRSTFGIKIQPSRAVEGTAVQPEAGAERTSVSGATRLADRGAREVKVVDFREDIPNENWLQGKIDYAQRSPRNEFGVPKMSSVTGSFKAPVMVPTRWFKDAKGQRGEEKNVRQKDLEAIRKIIRDTGKFPLNDDGTEYVPYVEIGYDGKPWVSEGNHRIMAAIAEGLEYMPIELRYFDGGQRRAGKFAPENIKEITDGLAEQDIFEQRKPANAPPTDSAAFKRWFGDSKVVDATGKPLVMYHGTSRDFNIFDRMKSAEFRRVSMDTVGSWFSNEPSKAEQYGGGEGLNVMPVYLSIKNPKLYRSFDDFLREMHEAEGRKFEDQNPKGVGSAEGLRAKLKAQGYDGIQFEQTDNASLYREIKDVQDAIGRARKEEFGVSRVDRAPYTMKRERLEKTLTSMQAELKQMGGSTEFDGQDVYVAFEPTQIKSATGNIGTYDPEIQDINMMEANPTRQNIFGEPVLGTWSITTDPKMELQDGLIYKMLDKNIDVKRIVEAVKSTGKEIASKWNPYLQEELYHGRTANASQEFQDKEWLPLLQDMDKKGVTVGELEKYLLNRHAEEYNKLVAKRNPTRPEMQDGGSSVTTEVAREYLADLDKDTKAKYEELAKRIDGITKGTRKLLVDTGYEKAETIEGWEKAFPNYVPLMREEANFDYNFGSFGTGRGFDVRRDFSRSAMGSKRNVVDIIGNVISARNNAIALTEKNRVAQAVYGLAVDAPNPDFWMAINPDAEKIPEDAIDELRAMGLDEEAVKHLMKEPKQRMLDPKRDEIVSRVNTKLRENDYVLATRINGERRYVFFNPKDPRANRAATALKNLGAQDLGVALGLIAKVTRWMASVNTQYNPIFGPYNFLRDVQSAALQLSTTELAGQQKEIAANVVPSLRVIYSSLRKRRKGEAATGEMADLWKEFQREGGQTGFKDNFSRTQDRTEALINEMEKITEGKVKANARAVFDWLSDYNDSLENAVRLSAYKVAKEKFANEGFSDSEAKQKAASLAKNLTVNFNRKGDVATQMGALYAFFNASMQGTARMIETLKGPAGKKIIAGGLLLGSMQAALMAAAGFDDEEPPEFIRSKNIVIPTGDGDYIAFPMPLGFHVIPGVSRILTEWTLSGFKDTARRVTDLTGLFLDAFNPIGNAGWSVQTITPTILDPLVALGENKDWTGKPISKEDLFSLRPTPGYTRAREGANVLSTSLAKFLNYASGGDEDRKGVLSPTPEQIEYLVGQAFGGVGREAIKLATTVEKTATGEELPPYKIPLYGRFVGETKSSAAESNRFYKNMVKLNELQAVVDGRKERKEPLGNFIRDNPEARLLPMANKTYKDVQALRKRRAALLERDAPRESIQAVEKQITRRMQVLNDRVRVLEESSN